MYAQQANTNHYVDGLSVFIPTSQTNSTTAIANYIQKNFKTQTERLQAAYSWVTTNIRYDTDSMYIINSDKSPADRITVALRRRKGVCENYAAIFNDIANKAGIPSYVVSGYTRQLGNVDKSGHTWCAIYLNKAWYLCDPTWDEGHSQFFRWFLISPSSFIESHIPFDPIWQLMDQPVSHKDFYNGNFYARNKSVYNFSDSIQAFLQLDSLQQLEATAYRVQEAGLANQLVINRLAYLRMQSGIIKEENDMMLYNNIVVDINHLQGIYNEFVLYRNNAFLPAKSDAQLSVMLDPVDAIFLSANKKLTALKKSTTNFQYDPGNIEFSLRSLSEKIQAQKDFLKEYLNTNPVNRSNLFYKQ